jgi:hypothetical protein
MSYVLIVPSAMWCRAIAKATPFFHLIIPNALVLLNWVKWRYVETVPACNWTKLSEVA